MAPIRSFPNNFLQGRSQGSYQSQPPHQASISKSRAVRLRELQAELETHNQAEEMVTYHAATDSWTPWFRPVRVNANGTMHAVAASGFCNIRDKSEYTPPICPHAADPRRPPEYSVMDLKTRTILPFQNKDKGKYDFFWASNHRCQFYVIVPTLQPPNFLCTFEQASEQAAHSSSFEEAADIFEGHSYDLDFLGTFDSPAQQSSTSSSIEEVENLLSSDHGNNNLSSPWTSPSPAVGSSSKAKGAPTSPLARRIPLAPPQNDPRCPGYNPRVHPDLALDHSTPPRPRQRHTSSTSPASNAAAERAISFFHENVAAARGSSDQILISNIRYNVAVGAYREDPSSHHAWDLKPTPLVLHPYDDTLYVKNINRIHQNLLHFDTSLGRVIRELNSTLGVPAATLKAIVELAVSCPACYCLFSPEGYREHCYSLTEKEPRCRNVPGQASHKGIDYPSGETDEDMLRRLTLRSFRSRTDLVAQEYLQSPIAVAFLEFNSRFGVPEDVFATITTACVECNSCHIVRTFPAHRGHLGLQGVCQDQGEEGAVVAQGKGKARAN